MPPNNLSISQFESRQTLLVIYLFKRDSKAIADCKAGPASTDWYFPNNRGQVIVPRNGELVVLNNPIAIGSKKLRRLERKVGFFASGNCFAGDACFGGLTNVRSRLKSEDGKRLAGKPSEFKERPPKCTDHKRNTYKQKLSNDRACKSNPHTHVSHDAAEKGDTHSEQIGELMVRFENGPSSDGDGSK